VDTYAVGEPRQAADNDPPIACTLEADAMPGRLDDWQALLGKARSRSALDGGGRRVEFGADVAVEDLARLVVAEQSCCAFFAFAITVDQRGVGLEVSAPDGATEIVDALFGGD
jgi:hypothetical protein